MDENEIYIKVTPNGPYLVWGINEIKEKIILADDKGVCIDYGTERIFEVKTSPAALCRCGKSNNSPFCDGSHGCGFDGSETASFNPIAQDAQIYKGPNLTLQDNEKFCAYARFCDANGSIWNLVTIGCKDTDNDAIREANLCPAGRLVIFDNNGNEIEHRLEKEVNILEDDGLKLSGPIWVTGRIKVISADNKVYEIRNRQTLCRCGKSNNKPFCDATHRHTGFIARYKKDI